MIILVLIKMLAAFLAEWLPKLVGWYLVVCVAYAITAYHGARRRWKLSRWEAFVFSLIVGFLPYFLGPGVALKYEHAHRKSGKNEESVKEQDDVQ